jgi:hypothetical protein
MRTMVFSCALSVRSKSERIVEIQNAGAVARVARHLAERLWVKAQEMEQE